jgi:hypothetical protein
MLIWSALTVSGRSYARDDLVLPRTGPSALHEIYLACATGRVLLIFARFCRAAFHVTLRCQVADFDFSFLVFRRLKLARFVRHNLHPRTPSTGATPAYGKIASPKCANIKFVIGRVRPDEDCYCQQRERGRAYRMRPVRRINNEVFICDNCGIRRRLDSAKRHWCDICTHEAPIEMRAARDKRLSQEILVSETP